MLQSKPLGAIAFSMRVRSASRLFGVALCCALGAGCGGVTNDVAEKVSVYPVKGSIVLADGKPLNGGKIEFIPTTEAARPAVGVIGPDGTYTVQTGGIGEGAAEGSYKVKIEPDYSKVEFPKKGKPAKTFPFALKYLEEDSSGLIATVKAGDNNLEPFRLK